jgi:hypothetical protein
MTINHINPVTRGNLLNIQEKITHLHPSYPHSLMLLQLLQKAVKLIENYSAESDKLFLLLKAIDFKSISSFKEDIFIHVQKEALAVISVVLGNELERPF